MSDGHEVILQLPVGGCFGETSTGRWWGDGVTPLPRNSRSSEESQRRRGWGGARSASSAVASSEFRSRIRQTSLRRRPYFTAVRCLTSKLSGDDLLGITCRR